MICIYAPSLKILHPGILHAPASHLCSIKMTSHPALYAHPLLPQNIPGQQTTSEFRGCQGLLFNGISEFLNAESMHFTV